MRFPLIAGLVCFVLAQGAAWLAWQQRPAAQLQYTAEDVSLGELYAEIDPGEMMGTLLLGGLRGLTIDLLWLRAMGAKEQGRFYESVALFQLISKMQPRFELVWEYMAWDMAYNIGHEIDFQEGKWAWFKAGVEAAAEGSLRNPRGLKIHRYLAWMFLHRGDKFADEVQAFDWRPVLDPIVSRYGRSVEPGSSAYEIAALLYQHCVEIGDQNDIDQPTFVRRMGPISLERDGNTLRNTGQHREALRRYLRALTRWQTVPEWAESVERNGYSYYSEDSIRLALDSYERNEGLLRRKAAGLASALAPDPLAAADAMDGILGRQFQKVAEIIEQDGWKDSVETGHAVRWYHLEEAPQP